MELTETSGLRPLVTKHGAKVKVFLQGGGGAQIVFDIGAHDSGGAFRSEREQFSITVREGVHFLFHDIRARPDASCEKLRELKNGHAYFAKSIEPGETASGGLDGLPSGNFIGQNVFDAFDTMDHKTKKGLRWARKRKDYNCEGKSSQRNQERRSRCLRPLKPGGIVRVYEKWRDPQAKKERRDARWTKSPSNCRGSHAAREVGLCARP